MAVNIHGRSIKMCIRDRNLIDTYGFYGALSFLHYLISIVAILVVIVMFQNWKEMQEEQRGQEPVSYTHLDVYKRQRYIRYSQQIICCGREVMEQVFLIVLSLIHI